MVIRNTFMQEIDVYFSKQQAVFNAHFRRLVAMRATLVELDASMSSPMHLVVDGQVKWQCPASVDLDSVLTEFDWSYKYDIAHCDELLYLLCIRTEATIYRDLAKRFNVRILHDNKLTDAYFNRKVWSGIEPDLTVVKDTFLALFDGLTLMERQLKDLRAFLRNRLFAQPMGYNGSVFSFRRVFQVSAWTLHVLREDQHLLLQIIRLVRYRFSGDFEWEQLVSPDTFRDLCKRLRRSVFVEVDSEYLKRIEIDDAGNFILDFASEHHSGAFSDLLEEVIKQPGMNIDF